MLGKSMSLVFSTIFVKSIVVFPYWQSLRLNPLLEGKKIYLLVREKGFLTNLIN